MTTLQPARPPVVSDQLQPKTTPVAVTAAARPVGLRRPRNLGPMSAVGLAVAAAWFVVFATLLSGLQEHGTQARLYATFRSQLANETTAAGAPIPSGAPVALLDVPGAGIDQVVVVEGTTSRQLLAGPGHSPDTPLPGQYGDSVLLGRALAYGGPFGRIGSLRAGDRLTVTTGQGTFTYRVEDVRGPGDRLPSPLTAQQSRLTLVTAAGGWLGPLTPTHAIYVDALLVKGTAQPVPAPLPAPAADALPMAGNPHALVPLIFWLEALVASGALAGLAWRRWGRWESWIVGVPLVVGAAWGTSEALIQFLPNLL